MDSTYKKFVVPNGITYIGKADSVKVFSGRKRVKISWLRGADPKAQKAIIYWNNKSDSVIIPIEVTHPEDTVSALIDNLPENTYNFMIYTLDDEGHSSVEVDAIGISYDSIYESTLLVRALKSIDQVDDTTSLSWYPSDTTSFVTELRYKDLQMNDKIVYASRDSSITILSDYLAGTYIYYRSLFKPDAMSLDTFYTKFDSVKLQANLLGNFNTWQMLKIANNNNTTFQLEQGNTILASSTAGGGHQGVYQAVEVEANAHYQIDMHVAGSGATNTWFEVYVGTKVPVQGSDYSDGGIRMGLNTWTGCGKTAFNDQLSNINCTGSGNLISFPSNGTVYVVIKSGGDNLGTTGITISNITMRRVD